MLIVLINIISTQNTQNQRTPKIRKVVFMNENEISYRIDLLVNNEVIIEVKAVEAVAPVHFAQLVKFK